MHSLRFCLFGCVRVSHSNRPQVEVKLSPAVQMLLAYLLLNRHRTFSRGVLAGVFWGDYDDERARHCLSTSLWRLRRALETASIAPDDCLVATAGGEIGLNSGADYWLDVDVFEDWLKQGFSNPVEAMKPAEVKLLEDASQIYVGDLMEGFYDDWVLRERERLRMAYLRCLKRLMHHYRHRGDYEHSLAYGSTILELDPMREEIHRELMRLHAENGQRALAVQQYEKCCQILADELDVSPMTETQLLYRQIRQGASHGFVTSPAGDSYLNLKETKQQLDEALQGLGRAQRQINRALQMMANLLEQGESEHSGADSNK